MVFFGNYFGSHVKRSSAELFGRVPVGIRNVHRVTEIYQIDEFVLVDHHIFQFDVLMRDPVLMANFYRFDDFKEDARLFFSRKEIITKK